MTAAPLGHSAVGSRDVGQGAKRPRAGSRRKAPHSSQDAGPLSVWVGLRSAIAHLVLPHAHPQPARPASPLPYCYLRSRLRASHPSASGCSRCGCGPWQQWLPPPRSPLLQKEGGVKSLGPPEQAGGQSQLALRKDLYSSCTRPGPWQTPPPPGRGSARWCPRVVGLGESPAAVSGRIF